MRVLLVYGHVHHGWSDVVGVFVNRDAGLDWFRGWDFRADRYDSATAEEWAGDAAKLLKTDFHERRD